MQRRPEYLGSAGEMNMKVIASLAIFALATLAHADRFAIYLPDLEAQQLADILQADYLTAAQRRSASAFLPYGLQTWPESEFATPTCGRSYERGVGVQWRRIIIDPALVDATRATRTNLVNLLNGIKARTDPEAAAKLAAITNITTLIQRCADRTATRTPTGGIGFPPPVPDPPVDPAPTN